MRSNSASFKNRDVLINISCHDWTIGESLSFNKICKVQQQKHQQQKDLFVPTTKRSVLFVFWTKELVTPNNCNAMIKTN